jgi:hypothetical protein
MRTLRYKASWPLVVSVILLGTFAYLRSVRATPPTAAETSPVCHDESVPALGGFNAEATCLAGQTATGGGYELVTPDFAQLLGGSVNESMPVFTGTTPTGWEVVGTNNTDLAGKIRVCVLCAQGDFSPGA